MANFKIGATDYSSYVNKLKVGYVTLLSNKGGRNANGDIVSDILSTKRVIEVGLRPLTDAEMKSILSAVEPYFVSISYRDPKTGALVTGVNVAVSTPDPKYYTIQNENFVLYNNLELTFEER